MENDELNATVCFLSDVFHHLNQLNLELQGMDKTVTELVEKLHAFQRKLSLFSVDLCPGKIPLGVLDRIPCTFKLLQFYSVPFNALFWWGYI